MEYRSFRHQKIIRFVSSPCGTGKTHATCHYIFRQKHARNHLYVAPSLKLLNETSAQLRDVGVDGQIISSETHPKRVKGTIIAHLKSALDCGHVLLITWNAFIDLPYFDRRSNWEVVIDEVPQVDRFYRLMLPHNHRFVTEELEAFPSHRPDLCLVAAKNQGRLRRLLDGPHDDVHELFRPLFRDVVSPNKSVYVDAQSWRRVAEHHDVSKQHEENTIYFVSMLNPDALLGAVLLGANLEDSLLHHWFAGRRVQFNEEERITSGLRAVPAGLGERLKISYFLPGRHISKSLSRKEANGGGNLIDRMDELAREEFAGELFIYMPNNDRDSKVIAAAPNVTQVPVVSNGLNSLQHHHNIYFSASLNREPKHFAMLDSLGLASDVVHQATAHETCYQAIMRTALRNPDSTEKVHAIVPDQPSAERLGDLLGCLEVSQIGDLLPRPKKAWSQTERSRRCRLGRGKEDIFVPKNQRDSSINEERRDSGTFLCSPPPNLSCAVTFHKTTYDKAPEQFRVRLYDPHDFIAFLKSAARTPIDSKDELFLWNPATFDPKGGEGYRRQDYFIRSSFLVLDFDGGTLSPEEFEDIFWRSAKRGQKHSFIIHSSFNRSKNHPNRFRVIFFYKRPARSLEDHKAAYDYVLDRLMEAGHSEDSAKLDPICKSGIQSFWLPSTNRAHPESAFFRTYGTKTRDLERCAIDPALCPRQRTDFNAATFSLNDAIIDVEFLKEAEMIDANLATMTSGRHKLFFRLGVFLARAGLAREEIQARLFGCAGHETKMRKKVPDILKSLEEYGWIVRF